MTTAGNGIKHLRDLRPDPANRRKHNPRNIGMVVDALQAVGAARSIVIDEDDVVLAGNGVVEAAAEAGITAVRVVEASGSEVVAVRRSGLSDEQKRALAMYDNRTGELAEWDAEQIRADIADGLDLRPWFSDAELAALVTTPALPNPAAQTDPELASEALVVIRCTKAALAGHLSATLTEWSTLDGVSIDIS